MPRKSPSISAKELKWAHEVYTSLGYTFPVHENDPDHVTLPDDLSMSSSQPDDQFKETAPQQKDYKSQHNILYIKFRKLMKSLSILRQQKGIISDLADLSQFNTLNMSALDALFNAQENLNAESPSDLTLVEGCLSEADDNFNEMQKVYQLTKNNLAIDMNAIGPRIREDLIKPEKKLQEVHRTRDDLEIWGIDPSELDHAYNKVSECITGINTAFNNSMMKEIKEISGHIKTDLERLNDVNNQAIRDIDIVKSERAAEVLRVNRAINELKEEFNRATVTPEQQSHFNNVADSAALYIDEANTAVTEGNGQIIQPALLGAQNQIIEMQQIMLQAEAASTEDDSKTRDDVYRERLCNDVKNMYQTIETVYAQRGFIENYEIAYPSFQREYMLACKGIVTAQFNLLEKDARATGDAQMKAVSIYEHIENMKYWLEQYKTALNLLTPSISQQQKRLENLVSNNLWVIEKLANLENQKHYTSNLKDFNRDCERAGMSFDEAADFTETGRIIEANEAITYCKDRVDKIEGIIRRRDYQTTINSTPTNEEEISRLHRKITIIRDENEEYYDRRDILKDNADFDVFVNMYNKVSDVLTTANDLLNKSMLQQCEETVENARITMGEARIAFERGLDTASKVMLYLSDAQSAKNKLQDLLGSVSTFTETDNKVEFLKRSKAATKAAHLAEALLVVGETKSARKVLEEMKGELAYLETYTNPSPPTQSKLKRRNAIKKKDGGGHGGGPFTSSLSQYRNYIQHWFPDASRQEAEKLLSDLYLPNVPDHSKVKAFKRLQEQAGSNYEKNFKAIENEQERIYSLLDFELKFDVHTVDPKNMKRELEEDIKRESQKPEKECGEQFRLDFERKTENTFTIESEPVEQSRTFEEITKKLEQDYSPSMRTAIFAICHQGLCAILTKDFAVLGSTHNETYDIKKTNEGHLRVHYQFEKDIASNVGTTGLDYLIEEIKENPTMLKKSIQVNATIEIRKDGKEVELIHADVLSQNDVTELVP